MVLNACYHTVVVRQDFTAERVCRAYTFKHGIVPVSYTHLFTGLSVTAKQVLSYSSEIRSNFLATSSAPPYRDFSLSFAGFVFSLSLIHI